MTRLSQETATSPSQLDVAVVIPTRNRPEKIGICLKAIAGQTFPRDRFQVIVVDDGSDAPLDSVVAPFCNAMNLRLIRQANAGPARARNVGAAHATAELLVFTDDDCEPDAEWMGELVGAHRKAPEALIGGHTRNALFDNPYSAASQSLIDYLYAYYASAPPGGRSSPGFFTSNNFAVPSRVFAQLGGFDETFPLAAGEDREFCERWQAKGLRLQAVPEAIIDHAHNLSLGRFWRQHVNYGRGAFHLERARLRHGRKALKREPLRFYFRLLAHPVRMTGVAGLRLVPLMWLSQVANVVGYIRESKKPSSRRSAAK
ncbi:MAG: glycosyltransferase [Vicinamibacterales bacterium]